MRTDQVVSGSNTREESALSGSIANKAIRDWARGNKGGSSHGGTKKKSRNLDPDSASGGRIFSAARKAEQRATTLTINTARTFASLDNSVDDCDPAVGIFEPCADNLVITGPTGAITCDESGTPASACPINIHVTGDMEIQAGGSIHADNLVGNGGQGGNITLDIDGNFTMRGPTVPGGTDGAFSLGPELQRRQFARRADPDHRRRRDSRHERRPGGRHLRHAPRRHPDGGRHPDHLELSPERRGRHRYVCRSRHHDSWNGRRRGFHRRRSRRCHYDPGLLRSVCRRHGTGPQPWAGPWPGPGSSARMRP